jgi:hypothetical protein
MGGEKKPADGGGARRRKRDDDADVAARERVEWYQRRGAAATATGSVNPEADSLSVGGEIGGGSRGGDGGPAFDGPAQQPIRKTKRAAAAPPPISPPPIKTPKKVDQL